MKAADLKSRGVKLKQMEQLYAVHGIKFIRFAVNDVREYELASNLFTAAQHLNSMINTLGLNVFVFCNSGLSRSPAVMLTYLALYK
jgi:protein-tyrosine phosphatase